MSNRYSDYPKGSSRSTRDDSRTQAYKESSWAGRDRKRSRSRSRSPRRQESPPARNSRYYSNRPDNPSSSRGRERTKEHKSYDLSQNDWEDSDEEVPAPPPPPRITKISIGFSKPKDPIKMTISGGLKPPTAAPKPKVASVFNDDDDDDEPEEMPAEAKMRMRNIGRETPTSAGPNSFGKTKQGFCDAKKVFEKNLKHALEINPAEAQATKFPQTIYKIKGP